MGDFNEKSKNGPVNRMLNTILTMAGARSWPAPFPVVDLDRIYFGGQWKLRSVHTFRSGSALIASDHAPLMAVLSLE